MKKFPPFTQALLKSVLLSFFLFISNFLSAQTPEEWLKVDGVTGCASIPYSDLREKCVSYQKVVKSACGIPRSCENFDPVSQRRNIDNINEKISNVKKEKEGYEGQKSRSTIDNEKKELETKITKCSDDIQKLESTIDKIKSEFRDEQSKIKDNAKVGDECLDNRISVLKIFDQARGKVDNAINNFDPKSKEIATRLYRHWREEAYGHEQQIYTVKTQVDKCKNKIY